MAQTDGSRAPLLSLSNIGKRYPGVVALDGVTLDIFRNETVGLVGENGAGKSTLLDILSGVRRPDSGSILRNGAPLVLDSAEDARRAGIFRVYQEQSLISVYTVMQNLFLGAEHYFTRYGLLDYKAMREAADAILSDLEISIDPQMKVSQLNFGTRQLIEIARMVALATYAKAEYPLVLLDEPTSSLSRHDLERFWSIVDKLKSKYNAALVFISHALEEVIQASDRLIVLKDGRVVQSCPPDTDKDTLHRLMVGRERAADFYATALQGTEQGPVVLRLDRLTGRNFADIDLVVHEKEIVGIGGLVQSGKTELGLAIFGAQSSTGGIEICGNPAAGASIAERIQLGAAYVPVERHRDGILLGRSIRDNISLPDLGGNVFGLVDDRRNDETARTAAAELGIKAPNVGVLAGQLSGGNQQKVVLAKWLKRGPRLLVLDNPTRGVDAGAKEEIYRLIRAVAARGCGILLITDDLVELIELSNRIYFMRSGRFSEMVEAPADGKPPEGDVIHLMV